MTSLHRINPTFHVSSRDRISGTNADFSYKIQLAPGNDYDLCAFTRLSIPKTYYTISNNNDTFVLNELVPVVINVAHGYYNVCNFPSTVQTALNNAGIWNYRVIYNKITKKLEFRVYGNTTQPEFDFSNTNIGQQMGWGSDSFTGTFVDGFLTSPKTVNFQKTRYISFVSNIAQTSGSLDAEGDTLLKIPVENVGDGQMILYEIHDILDSARPVASHASQSYRFTLVDDNGDILELNNEWTFDVFYWKYDFYHKLRITQIEGQKQTDQEIAVEQEET